MANKFVTPQKCSAKVVISNFINSKVIELNLRLENPKEFHFEPGQFVSLKVSDTAYRSYSIASDYKEANQITLLAAAAHEGVGANYIRSLKIGDEVVLIGPSGRFVLPETLKQKLVFVATGTGIAPIFSMLYKLTDIQTESEVTVLFGVRDETELIRPGLFELFNSKLKNFNYRICFSQKEQKGRVTDHIPFNNISKTPNKYQVFLCGNPTMVGEVYEQLKAKGLPQESIIHEKFTVTVKNSTVKNL